MSSVLLFNLYLYTFNWKEFKCIQVQYLYTFKFFPNHIKEGSELFQIYKTKVSVLFHAISRLCILFLVVLLTCNWVRVFSLLHNPQCSPYSISKGCRCLYSLTEEKVKGIFIVKAKLMMNLFKHPVTNVYHKNRLTAMTLNETCIQLHFLLSRFSIFTVFKTAWQWHPV